ncbi:MAG: Ig-like domain-containing protein [Candidatus Magasanikbacteria bacterium]
MKNKYRIIFTILAVFLFLGFAQSTFAQTATDTLGIDSVDDSQLALASTDIRTIVVKIINTILGLLGIIAVSLIIYAGFVIMTSGGDESKVANGRKIIINAVIGLVIIFSAWAIVKFALSRLGQATGINSGNNSSVQTPNGLNSFSGSASLGRIVKDHYPFRNQKNVARNSSVVVTFNFPIDPASVMSNTNNTCWNNDFTGPTSTCITENGKIKDSYYGDCYLDGTSMKCDTLNTSTVKIDTSVNIVNANSGIAANVMASYDNDKNLYTLVFKPLSYLGSATENVPYTVQLLEGIKKSGSNDSIFIGLSNRKYIWNFETGTNLDLNPPYITSVYPNNNTTTTKDIIIQINFNEPIDPTTVQGLLNSTGEFDNILVNTLGKAVTGTWQMSNAYKTVEFVPVDICGQNSCGQTRYCLPVVCTESDPQCTKPFEVLVRTAQSKMNNEAPFEAVPFSGVYDLAFNALDNLSNNPLTGVYSLVKPQIVPGKIIYEDEKKPDNYFWGFGIQNKIDKKIPYIEYIKPNIDEEDIIDNAVVSMVFSKVLRMGTIDKIGLNEYPEDVCIDAASTTTPCSTTRERLDNIWYRVWADNTGNKTIVAIDHREFGPNGLDLYYFPTVPNTLQDNHQNCFYPGFGPDTTNAEKCTLNYDTDNNITSVQNCIVGFDYNNDTDTACGFKLNASSIPTTTANLKECLNLLKTNSISTYTNLR